MKAEMQSFYQQQTIKTAIQECAVFNTARLLLITIHLETKNFRLLGFVGTFSASQKEQQNYRISRP